MKILLNFFYLNNFFRLCIYTLKLILIFNKKEKCRLAFFNFFKKRKKLFSKDLLTSMYNPKVFIINTRVNSHEIIEKIYNYPNLYKKNKFSDHGHIEVYQSDHNLNQMESFFVVSKTITNLVNNKIISFYNFHKLLLIEMWFVVTKQSGLINKHSHFGSDLSGVLYLKVDNQNKNLSSGLKIYNTFKKLEIYTYSSSNNEFKKEVCEKEYFLFKPNTNDLIIFNSFLEHSVDNSGAKISERISLPFNLVFSDK